MRLVDVVAESVGPVRAKEVRLIDVAVGLVFLPDDAFEVANGLRRRGRVDGDAADPGSRAKARVDRVDAVDDRRRAAADAIADTRSPGPRNRSLSSSSAVPSPAANE